MSGIGLALSAASAFMRFRAGQAQAANFKSQAQGLEVASEFTRFKGKQESLKHKKTSVDQLELILNNSAALNAIGAARNMGIFTGNVDGLKRRGLDVGGTNFAMSAGNELIARLTGEAQANMQLYQAANLRRAAGHARTSGIMGAMLTLGAGAYMSYSTMIPNMGSTVPTTGPGAFGGSGAFATSAVPINQAVSGTFGMPPTMAPLYYGQRVGPGMLGL
jgi:hypothetical protein